MLSSFNFIIGQKGIRPIQTIVYCGSYGVHFFAFDLHSVAKAGIWSASETKVQTFGRSGCDSGL